MLTFKHSLAIEFKIINSQDGFKNAKMTRYNSFFIKRIIKFCTISVIYTLFLNSTFSQRKICFNCQTSSKATGQDISHTGRGGAFVRSSLIETSRIGNTNSYSCPEFLTNLQNSFMMAGWVTEPPANDPFTGKTWFCITSDLAGNEPLGGGTGWSDAGLRSASAEWRAVPPPAPMPPIAAAIPKVPEEDVPHGGEVMVMIELSNGESIETSIPTHAMTAVQINQVLFNELYDTGVLQIQEGFREFPISLDNDSMSCFPSFIISSSDSAERIVKISHYVTDIGISVAGASFNNSSCIGNMDLKIIASAGAYQKNNNYSLAWTLGEPVVETFFQSVPDINCYVLRQGFQQPFGTEPGLNPDCTVVSTIEIGSETISIQVFPNPSEGYVTVALDKAFPHILSVSTLAGSLLSVLESQDIQDQVNLNGLPSGFYILTVADFYSNARRSFKIQKF